LLIGLAPQGLGQDKGMKVYLLVDLMAGSLVDQSANHLADGKVVKRVASTAEKTADLFGSKTVDCLG